MDHLAGIIQTTKQFSNLRIQELFWCFSANIFVDKNLKKTRHFQFHHKLQKCCKHTSQQKLKSIHEKVKENFLQSSGKRQLIQISFTLVEPRVLSSTGKSNKDQIHIILRPNSPVFGSSFYGSSLETSLGSSFLQIFFY